MTLNDTHHLWSMFSKHCLHIHKERIIGWQLVETCFCLIHFFSPLNISEIGDTLNARTVLFQIDLFGYSIVAKAIRNSSLLTLKKFSYFIFPFRSQQFRFQHWTKQKILWNETVFVKQTRQRRRGGSRCSGRTIAAPVAIASGN